jgi:hypothetical protein
LLAPLGLLFGGRSVIRANGQRATAAPVGCLGHLEIINASDVLDNVVARGSCSAWPPADEHAAGSCFASLHARIFSETDHFVMAITAAKAMVRHIPRRADLQGRTQMTKTTLSAVAAAALIATGLGVWAASPTTAHVSTGAAAAALIAITGFGPTQARVPSTGPGIEPLQVMTNANGLPTEEFVDYTFVFTH